MNLRSILLLLLSGLLVTTSALVLYAETGESAIVQAASGINLRDQPSVVNSKVIFTIPDKSEVKILDKDGPVVEIENHRARWFKVEYQGKTGWVYSGFLQLMGAGAKGALSQQAEDLKKKIQGKLLGVLNFRALPGSEFFCHNRRYLSRTGGVQGGPNPMEIGTWQVSADGARITIRVTLRCVAGFPGHEAERFECFPVQGNKEYTRRDIEILENPPSNVSVFGFFAKPSIDEPKECSSVVMPKSYRDLLEIPDQSRKQPTAGTRLSRASSEKITEWKKSIPTSTLSFGPLIMMPSGIFCGNRDWFFYSWGSNSKGIGVGTYALSESGLHIKVIRRCDTDSAVTWRGQTPNKLTNCRTLSPMEEFSYTPEDVELMLNPPPHIMTTPILAKGNGKDIPECSLSSLPGPGMMGR